MKSSLLLILLFSFRALAQQYSRDFILKDPKKFSKVLGSRCVSALATFYEQDKRLISQIFTDASFPMSDLGNIDPELEKVRGEITNTPENAFTFYHYTASYSLASDFRPQESDRDEVFPEIKEKVFDKITSFIKNPRPGDSIFFDSKKLRSSRTFFYVSSCPTCSHHFGNVQLSFTFSPSARAIIIPSMNMKKYDWNPVRREMEQSYPKIFKACQFDLVGHLILEDSGIDIIKYDDGNWYQITNFNKVLNSDVLIFPVMSYKKADEETKERARSRTYSLIPLN